MLDWPNTDQQVMRFNDCLFSFGMEKGIYQFEQFALKLSFGP